MEGMRPRPTLVLNPPDDHAFRAAAEDLLATGIARAEALQAELRSRYAAAIVRPRELAGEQTQIWYVYRDGHWVQPAAG
jgi:hypothetical protein